MNIILCSEEDSSRSLSHGLVLCTEEEADDYLMHYRVGGEKKGVRKYQNEDGSLTPLGRIHYGVGTGDRLSKKAEKYAAKASKSEAAYVKATRKSEKARAKADRKGDPKSMAKAEEREHAAQVAKLKMEEFKDKASMTSQKAKEAYDHSLKKIDRDRNKSGGDPDASDQIRGLIESKSTDSQRNVDDTLAGIGMRDKIRAEREFANNVNRFDSLSSKQQKDVSDEVLFRVHDFDTNSSSKVDKDQAEALRGFIFDRIDKKSGNWNTGESVSENNRRAMENMNNCYDKEAKRIEEVKKEIDYTDKNRYEREHPFLSIFASNEFYSGEAKRLKSALKNDSAYQALKAASAQSEKDLCGAVLRDIGFADTPENRDMIFRYVFLD